MKSITENSGLKILYHHRTQGRGAEGVHIASIVGALESLGHRVTVVSPPGIDPLATAGNAPVDKANVDTRGIGSLWKFVSRRLPNFLFEMIEIAYNLPAFWRLYRATRNAGYDLIYERYAFYLLAGAWTSQLLGIPLILEANEVSGIAGRARIQSFPRLCSIFERYLFSRCRSILTVSSRLRELTVQQGVDAVHVKVVPNAIDPGKFDLKPDSRDLGKKLGFEGKLVMGFAGWFDHWDRLDLLIEVFAKIHRLYPQTALLLIGDGSALEVVRERVGKYALDAVVVMTGAVGRDEVARYLSLLDIAVITHSNEFGSPVVMFEFMGLRIPVVAPRIMPITDVMRDGETAVLFDELDMNQMQARITELIESEPDRMRLAENAHELLIDSHTWKDNARIIIEQADIRT